MCPNIALALCYPHSNSRHFPFNPIQIYQTSYKAEEVQHGVIAGVKCVWNVITADKYNFVLETLYYFQFSLKPAQALFLWMLSKCKVQTQIQK